MRKQVCLPGVPNVFIRNIAARGRAATFVVRVESVSGGPVTGTVEVRHSPLPFMLISKRQTLQLTDGMTVKRGFFDASFELVVDTDVEATVTVV